MRLVTIGATALLLGLAACTPKAEKPLLSAEWLAADTIAAEHPSAQKRSSQRDPVKTRMLTRSESHVHPLSVTFVGPQDFAPRDLGRRSGEAPRILPAASPLQCVPFARELSGIGLRGNAWTWWGKADGLYRRSDRPEVGSIMVLSKTQRLRLGHLAVVTEIVSDREIVVSHANWLNKGQIHLDTPVVDVSPKNDWSLIRAWYTPGQTMGLNVYAVSGFILPDPVQSARSGS